MIKMHKVVVAASLLAVVAAIGCSSSSNDSSSTVYCVNHVAGQQTCAIYKNLTPDEQKQMADTCSQMGGTVAGSCPSENQVGCCSMTSASRIQIASCYYPPAGDAGTTGGDAGLSATYKQDCLSQNGTWTGS